MAAGGESVKNPVGFLGILCSESVLDERDGVGVFGIFLLDVYCGLCWDNEVAEYDA